MRPVPCCGAKSRMLVPLLQAGWIRPNSQATKTVEGKSLSECLWCFQPNGAAGCWISQSSNCSGWTCSTPPACATSWASAGCTWCLRWRCVVRGSSHAQLGGAAVGAAPPGWGQTLCQAAAVQSCGPGREAACGEATPRVARCCTPRRSARQHRLAGWDWYAVSDVTPGCACAQQLQ